MNNTLQQPFPTGPNQHVPSTESRAVRPDVKNPAAFPVEHLSPAVAEAEAIVRDAYSRVQHEEAAPSAPEIDMQAEFAAAETIKHASREIVQARQHMITAAMIERDRR